MLFSFNLAITVCIQALSVHWDYKVHIHHETIWTRADFMQ